MKKLTEHFNEKQKSLFLIDSAGAFATAVPSFALVRKFNGFWDGNKKKPNQLKD